MGKLVPFKPKPGRQDKQARKLMEISDSIDAVILQHMKEGVEATDIAAVLAHRLGTLLNHLDQKTTLWEFCEKVLRQQADLDESV